MCDIIPSYDVIKHGLKELKSMGEKSLLNVDNGSLNYFFIVFHSY
jgi:hypothetical protein